MRGKAPDYIGIGAGRCGTTSLHHVLRSHPQICELKRKEVHYFDRKYRNRPIDWYFRLFTFRRAHKPDCTIAGEITPSYFFAPGVAERVHRHCPKVKLLVLLRDPVDAFQSSWSRQVSRRLSHKPLGFYFDSESGENVPSLVDRRNYAKYLRNWFEFFDRGQFWIMQSERLFQRPGKVLRTLWEFLEVNQVKVKFPHLMSISHSRVPDDPALQQRMAETFQPFNEDLYELLGKRYNWQAP